MFTPPFLQPGDKVAIVSPASAVKPEFIDGACYVLEQWGFTPVPSEHCRNSVGYYSGTVEERLNDLRQAIFDPEIKAILCGRGGYGTIHLTDFISTNELKINPKWIIGFSDISALHAMCHRAGIASIHSSMAKQLALFGTDNHCNKALLNILTGQLPTYTTPSHPFNRMGSVTGEIVGGNLAVLSGLIGTEYDLLLPDKILFIEDIAEPIYKVERILYNLRLSGGLQRLKGLIVGQFTDYREPDANGDTMYGMIRRMIEPYDYPVCFDFPIGHIDGNLPVIEGATASLNITPHEAKLEFLHI